MSKIMNGHCVIKDYSVVSRHRSREAADAAAEKLNRKEPRSMRMGPDTHIGPYYVVPLRDGVLGLIGED